MSQLGITVGAANVRVLPNTKNFASSLERFLERMERTHRLAVGLVVDQDAFSQRVQQAVGAAQKAAGEIEAGFDIDPVGLVRAVRRAVGAAQQAAGDIDVKVDVDGAGAVARAKAVGAAANAAAGNIHMKIKVDRSALAIGLRGLSTALGGFGAVAGRVNGIVSSTLSGFGGMVASVGQLSLVAGAASVAVGGIAPVIAALGTAAVQAAAPIAGLGAALAPGALLAAGGAIGTLKLALTGVGSALSIEDWGTFNEYMAGLPPAVSQAMTPLFAMKEALKDVQNVAQQAFFEPLDNLQNLHAFIEPVRKAIAGIASEFGLAARSVVEFTGTSTGIDVVNVLIGNASYSAGQFAHALGGAFRGVVTAGAAASPILSELSERMREAAEVWAEKMVASYEDGSLTTYFQRAVENVQAFGAVLGDIGGIIGGVFSAANQAGQPMLGTLGQLLNATHAWVDSVEGKTALVEFFRSMQAAVAAVAPLLGQFAGIIGGTVAPAVAQAIQTLAPFVEKVIAQMGVIFEKLVPVLDQVALALGQAFESLAPVLPIVADAFIQILNALLPLVPEFARMAADLLPALTPLLVIMADGLSEILRVAIELGPILAAAGIAFLAVTNPVTAVIAGVALVIGVLKEFGPEIKAFFVELGNTISTWVQDTIGAVVGWFSEKFAQIKQMPGEALRVVVEAFGWFKDSVIDRAANAMSGMVDSISSGIDTAIEWVKSLPSRAANALSGIGDFLYNSGAALIRGFIDGILSMFSAVGDAVGSVLDYASSYFPHSPAKRGPFSGRGWVLYSGRAIGSDFAKGISDSTAAAVAAAGGMASATSARMRGIGASVPKAQSAATGADYSVHVGTIVAADPSAPMREIQQRQRMAMARRGR